MGPIFNFTTDFNRVTKQDVSDVNSPPLRESSEKVLFYLHPSSRGLSWIRDRLSFASRGLQLLPPRDRPSQQADRNDQHPRAALPSWLGLSRLARPGGLERLCADKRPPRASASLRPKP